ncbi:unnamed protein product, partial [Brassica napus]
LVLSLFALSRSTFSAFNRRRFSILGCSWRKQLSFEYISIMANIDPEIAKTQEERRKLEAEREGVSLTFVTLDRDLYGGNERDSYSTSIAPNDEEDPNLDTHGSLVAQRLASFTAPKSILNEVARLHSEDDDDDGGFKPRQTIAEREGEYRNRRLNRVLSPDRVDPFAMGEKTPDPSVRTYNDHMRETAVQREREETLRLIAKKKKVAEEAAKKQKDSAHSKKRNRWEQDGGAETSSKKAKASDSVWDATPGRVSVGRRNRWDEPTPGRVTDSDATPSGVTWDSTPKGYATPTPKRQRSSLLLMFPFDPLLGRL